MPRIHSIYIASQAGEPINKRESVRLIVGAGIEDANQELEASGLKPYLPSEVRRNIVIEDMSSDALNQLIGKEFSLGFIRLRATELCTPCERPAKLSEKLNFLSAFKNRGGIRAQILDAGDITVGDQLS
jgi:MOSC domain-containing protein YiiM